MASGACCVVWPQGRTGQRGSLPDACARTDQRACGAGGADGTLRDAVRIERERLHRLVLTAVREDDVCRRLTTVPGVGPVTALTFCSAVDDPARFSRSRAVGAHFGLTPGATSRVRQTGWGTSASRATAWRAKRS
ncbi:transposase [Pseudoroseomonas wenyumeiae]